MINKRKFIQLVIIIAVMFIFTSAAYADTPITLPKIPMANTPQEVSSSIQVLLLITVLALAPSILIMMTSFTRIIIVLSFLRNALGTQQMPPNQVLIGLALFLSLFIMMPVGTDIYNQAYKPYSNSQITSTEALNRASTSIKGWMLKQMGSKEKEKDLAMFASLSGIKLPVQKEKLPLNVVIPAFMISELKTAFIMGFLIFIPFLVIDMVVSSTLMSMGMMMLPPVMISLPFKILLFILVDGWKLVTQALVSGFVK
ncbi:MAG: flagellar type III secretion system pore protein FliP [Bacillota bacterium]|nr:flagellar type III secretion system pore protein FliP [Bacillota bacterium]